MKKAFKLFFAIVFLISGLSAQSQLPDREVIRPKPASTFTEKANQRVLNDLNFMDTTDYKNARRGLIAPFTSGIIKDASGKVVWNMKQYDFLNRLTPQNAPATVNPSLWRQEQLNNYAGLFEVKDQKIYQIRGFDLSVMTLIKGNTGWIVIDPLVSAETAKAGLDTANKYLGTRPVSAVIFTHSHIDHYGGVLGVVNQSQLGTGPGKVPIYAPADFLDHAMSENIIAGTAMGRRASYMYGNTMILHDAKSQVGSGLGKTTSSGQNGVAQPTISISATITAPQKDTIDGVRVEFWNTPNTEAPTEMMFFFPDLKAFCSAEEITHTLHNTYSLRGTQVRDPLAWSQDISDALDTYGGNMEVMFASHHWPTWGRDTIIHLLKKQRDLYKYINDQTLRLANQGYTMIEIAEMIALPKSLSDEFADRGYYGTVNHNVKAVYQRYLGWFDGNPANLHALPPTEAGKKYVEFMGGADSLLKHARKSYDKGEYRWVGMVVNHLVFAYPDNIAARNLLADAYEQMGYQAESGPWRNFYLTGARELRDTARVSLLAKKNPVTPSLVDLDNMPLTSYFEYLAIHVNGPKAAGSKFAFNLVMTEPDNSKTNAVLRLENAVLNTYFSEKTVPDAPTIQLSRSLLNQIMIQAGTAGQQLFQQAVANNTASISGPNQPGWNTFLGYLDPFPFWFNIIEP